jgi:DNA polymerase I-like protein with 3'-5' exonuclease and polymerase domains
MLAETTYLLRLGIEPPPRWWDVMLAYRYLTNSEKVDPRYGLAVVLARYGLPYRHTADEKDALRDWIGDLHFNPDSPDERRRIVDYCYEDCEGAARLYRHLAARVPPAWAALVAEFCLHLARMELRGIAVDMPTWRALDEKRQAVIDRLTAVVNAQHPVFVSNSLSRDRFFGWCAANGIGWPLSRSPHTGRRYLSLDHRIMDGMRDRHPFINDVAEVNNTVRQLTSRSLAVDENRGRHYFREIPFGASTGRTSFKGFLLSAPKWLRFLAVPTSPDHVLLSVDYDAEEILIGAMLAHDDVMRAGYASGDPHMAFAVKAGAAPPGATKATHGEVRRVYKAVNLAVNYGQTEYGIAEKTGMPVAKARSLLEQHQKVFAAYTAWSDAYVVRAHKDGRCWTALGWPRWVTRGDNRRSVANFPVQGTGADLMRLTVIHLSRGGLNLLATNHDGFLIECQRDHVVSAREAIDASLHAAVAHLLPGAPMRWTVEEFGERYRDPDGERLWRQVQGVLGGKGRTRARSARSRIGVGR